MNQVKVRRTDLLAKVATNRDAWSISSFFLIAPNRGGFGNWWKQAVSVPVWS
jgi:hypothetical protein